jgi:putative nucleotidyltransferase with HDIG domain
MKVSDLPDRAGSVAEKLATTPLTLETIARWPWNTVYLSAAIAGGVAAVLWSIGALIAAPIAWPFFILIGLTILSRGAMLRLPNSPVSFSISDSFTITAALLFGPEAGTIAVAIDSLVISYQLARRNFGVRRLLFNAVAPALAMWTAAHCFFWVAGVAPLVQPAHSIGRLVGPLMMFAALYFVLNTGLIAGAISLEQRTSPLAIWRRHFLPLWLTYFGGAGVAALLITLLYTRGTNLVALGFVAPIPFILYATFKNALGRMEDRYVHLGHVNRMYLSTIETLAHAIDAKDQVTHGHIRRVQQHAMRLARALGIEDEGELQAIDAASLLHDMGKLAVPEHILNKPGKLTPAEFDKMKLHATIGADILSSVDFPYPVVPIVRHHHEHWDGGGYPAGLKGEAIPVGARILAVVDCFDALTSDRPYRPKMTSADAIAILREWSGSHYEPRIVEKFVEIHAEDGPGEESSASASAAFSAITDAAVQKDAARRGDAGPSYDLGALEIVYELGAAMATASDPGAVIERLHGALRPLMPAACTVVYVYEPTSDALIARHASGQHADALCGLAIPLGQRLTGWVAAQRSTVINSDAALDLGNLTMRLTPPPHTCLSTVLCVDDELVGVVTVYSTTLEPFTDRHGALLEVLAPKLAAAVRKGRGTSTPRAAASSTAERSTGPSLLRLAR